jgi:ArsR family metal-binding transcriptional regulator
MIMTLTSTERMHRHKAALHLKYINIITKLLKGGELSVEEADYLNEWKEWSDNVYSRTEHKIGKAGRKPASSQEEE